MNTRTIHFLLICGVIFSVIIYGIIIIYLSWPISSYSIASAGTFGDSYGILTSLFSGLAFAFLIVTINLQKEELSLQRKELSMTRDELKEQKIEFKTQNDTLKKQRFENTFFHLMSLHNQNTQSLAYRADSEGNVRTSRDCFGAFIKDLKLSVVSSGIIDGNEMHSTIPDNYNNNYKRIAKYIEHYQKTIYQILLFINNSDDEINKKQYSNFLRSQFSLEELELLFFHCLSEYGREKFKKLVEDYEFFEHLKRNDLIDKCMTEYDKKVFGKNNLLLEKYESITNNI